MNNQKNSSLTETSTEIAFTDIFFKKECLTVILSDDFFLNLEVIEKIICWNIFFRDDKTENTYFKRIICLFPDFQVSFFEKLLEDYNITIAGLSEFNNNVQDNIIINFNKNNSILKQYEGETVIMGIGKYVNVKFRPNNSSFDSILLSISQLLNLPYPKPTIDFSCNYFNQQKRNIQANKYLVIIKNPIKRKFVSNKLPQEAKPSFISSNSKSISYSTDTQSQTKNLQSSLRDIIDECYNADKIITDNLQWKQLLEKLGFESSIFQSFFKLTKNNSIYQLT